MYSDVLEQPEILDKGKQFMEHLETGNAKQAGQLLSEILEMRESALFQELGQLTRQLHESLKTVRWDDRIEELASAEMPEARDRLSYVLNLTDQAATKTLSVVEETVPLSENIYTQATELSDNWNRFTSRQMNLDEFKKLSCEISHFLGATSDQASSIKDKLNEVIIAQDYQDLTGQILHRVIEMVQKLEDSLVETIKRCAIHQPAEKDASKIEDSGKLAGPQIPGWESSDVVESQDEVDQLLSELGF